VPICAEVILTLLKLICLRAIAHANYLAGNVDECFFAASIQQPANPKKISTMKPTGPEIWEDTDGDFLGFCRWRLEPGGFTAHGSWTILKQQNPLLQELLLVEPLP